MLRTLFVTLALWMMISSFVPGQQPPATGQAAKPAPNREELEKQFAESLSGATLVGHFTITGQKNDQPLKEERYTLGKGSKLKNGDFWSFQARIQYGDHDVNVPLALEVKWAGDTPLITLTDIAIPGLGTYTSRVLFYRDQYAGTWSGATHGGHLFGKVVKENAGGQPAEK
jgi:hypothetical protein